VMVDPADKYPAEIVEPFVAGGDYSSFEAGLELGG